MKNKNPYILAVIALLSLVAGFCIHAVVDPKDPDRDYHIAFERNYRIFTPDLPVSADFAGEKAPLDNILVRESLDREIMAGTFMHSSTNLMFKRAHRWFPVIEPILKQNNIPDDFKYLAVAESNISNVVSPSHAEGFWQFLKPTGQKYGLEITEEVDERYNLEKATSAACHYFKDAYAKYKSWALVAASYNRGMDALSDAIASQKADNYYDLYLVEETARYVFRILALKEIYLHPVLYGFYLREKDFYPVIPTYSVTVDSTITDLPAFAKKMNVNYKVMREFNPWIRRYNLPNKTNKAYTFLLPKDASLSYETLRKSLRETDLFYHDTLHFQDIH